MTFFLMIQLSNILFQKIILNKQKITNILDISQFLISQGCDIMAKNNEGKTSLQYSSIKSNIDMNEMFNFSRG